MLKYHIQTIEVGASTASDITFSNIPQTYDDLFLIVSGRSNRSDTRDDVKIFFNNDTSSTYAYRRLIAYDANSSYTNSGTGINSNDNFVGNTATSGTFSNMQILIPNYKSNLSKSFSVDYGAENNSSAWISGISSHVWSGTSPINSVTFAPSLGTAFTQYSSVSLYGIKRGFDGKTEMPFGGIITTSGGYTIHTFNASGTFVANRNMDVEYLVIAGGGGGGYYYGAGGGAGGYRSSVIGEMSGGGATAESKLNVSAGQSISVTVGAGGAFGYTSTLAGFNGNDSSLGTITSIGGGGGGGRGPSNPTSTAYGRAGGSGGGGGGEASGGLTFTGGAGTAGQGFNGENSPGNYQGGGGGAGEAGGTDGGKQGGDGVQSSISGTPTYRAGGGGASQAAGGLGGGGSLGSAGTANTGGGGAGDDSVINGNGGSGIVIIRYLTPA